MPVTSKIKLKQLFLTLSKSAALVAPGASRGWDVPQKVRHLPGGVKHEHAGRKGEGSMCASSASGLTFLWLLPLWASAHPKVPASLSCVFLGIDSFLLWNN